MDVLLNDGSEVQQPVDMKTLLTGLDGVHKSFLLMSISLTCIVFFISFLHAFVINQYVSNERIQTNLYYIAFLFPMTSLCALVGMMVPRAATFLYAVALVYLMLCLFVCVSLLFNISGGRQQFCRTLYSSGRQLSLRVTPLCCFKSLPSIAPSESNVRRVEWMVLQSPLLRLILEAANVVVFLEINHRQHIWFLFSQLLGLLSMLFASYGCYILVAACSCEVRPHRFLVLFRCVDIAQCLYTIQKLSFDLAALAGLVRPDPLFSPSAKAQFWTSFMLTWEMLLMSCLLTYLLRPGQSSLLDKYRRSPSIADASFSDPSGTKNPRAHPTAGSLPPSPSSPWRRLPPMTDRI